MFSLRSLTGRRMITGLALLAYIASVTGYPMTVAVVAETGSTPFPCQGHACGCRSAEQCWESCCCYSAAERLAWVHEHHIHLPEATKTALEAEVRQTARASRGCCASKALPEKSCTACNTTGTCAHKIDSHDEAMTHVVWVNAIQAQKCQGATTLWLTTGANLPVEIPTLWQFEWTPAGRVPLADDLLLAQGDLPPVPPPRV